MIIESRLGRVEVDTDRILTFPHGVIGFEHLRRFVLLQISDNSPFLVLQSLEDKGFGLMVADPFTFLTNFALEIGDAEQARLGATAPEELAVLVTVSIPPGRPDETALNLMGPIIVNHVKRVGLQVPQPDTGGPQRVYVSTLLLEQDGQAAPEKITPEKATPEKNTTAEKP